MTHANSQAEIARQGAAISRPTISIVIPTYNREAVLLETINHVLSLSGPRRELIVVDQTPKHSDATSAVLRDLDARQEIRWLRLEAPSITHAMNVGITQSTGDVVLFLDDDVIPDPALLEAHASAHESGHRIVAGRVVQPWERDKEASSSATTPFRFSSRERRWISEVMGGNLSARRELLLSVGGFDENFVRVAYQFEAEFSARALAAGERILFLPEASLDHLKAKSGGTRHFGDHLRTSRAAHSVGAYYYIFRAPGSKNRAGRAAARMFASCRTRFHLRHPWFIPSTIIAELSGCIWALWLWARGPRLLSFDRVSIET